MFAPFMIDTTQPESDMRFRFTPDLQEIDPDRVEYLWGHSRREGAAAARAIGGLSGSAVPLGKSPWARLSRSPPKCRWK